MSLPTPSAATNPGLSRLVPLFAADVRARGVSYVNQDRIEILSSTADMLFADVTGSDAYATLYQRIGATVYYGCTCPYFVEGLEGCKHLWAVALEGAQGPLVRSLSEQSYFEPSIEVLFTEPTEDATAPGVVPRAGSARKEKELPEVGWRELVAATGPSTKVANRELVYFWVPGRSEQEHKIVLQQRRLGTDGPLKSASNARVNDFADTVDRELFGLLQAGFSRHHYGDRELLSVPSGALAFFLKRLADTGRCHVVPHGQPQQCEQWLRTIAGMRPLKAARSSRPGDRDRSPLLAWPVLEREEGVTHFQLRLVETQTHRRVSDMPEYAVDAEIVSGEDRHDMAGVTVATEDIVVVGNRLFSSQPDAVQWVRALGRMPRVHVSEVELPAFVERAQARGARVVLPPSYTTVESAVTPTPVLHMAAPGTRDTSAEVSFEYAGRTVPALARSSVLFLADRTVVPRAVDAERRAIEQLRELGLKGPLLTLGARATRTSAGDVVIPEQALLATVRALLSSGWKVFAAGKRYRQGSTINVVVESGIDWFEVGGEADFAGVHVPLPRLLRELKRGRSYVELGDGEIGLIPEEWMARWGLFASVLPDNAEVLRFSNRQLGLMEALLRAEPDESGSESLKALRSKLDSFHAIVPAPPPATFKGELRPYQSLGLGWLHAMRQLGFGVCLADDMGLGKTVQLLAHLAGVHGPRPVRASRNSRKARARTVPSLVVVPRSLVGNGMDEARRFAPELRLHVHWGAERGAPSEWTDADVVITTYGTLRADIDAVSRVPLETVVLDEAQAIKNESSATAKCVKLLRARHRIALTGTPVENHAGELWSLFDFMNPGMLAELPGLKKGVFGSTKPSAVSLDLVQRVIRPFVLRRKKSEVAKDLPERVEQTLFVELEKDERAEYEELARHYRDVVGRKLAELGADRATPHVLEALLRLRQAACHPGLVDTARVGEPSAKITALLEQLEELREEGHKALVFSQFTSLLRIVRRELESRNIRHEYLDGKTRDRAARVESFQNNPDTAVFLISLKAGGVGLNLTAADYVFILDPWWNPRRRGTSHRPRTPHRPDPFSDRLPLAHTRHDRRTSCGATGDEARSRVRPHGRDRHPS